MQHGASWISSTSLPCHGKKTFLLGLLKEMMKHKNCRGVSRLPNIALRGSECIKIKIEQMCVEKQSEVRPRFHCLQCGPEESSAITFFRKTLDPLFTRNRRKILHQQHSEDLKHPAESSSQRCYWHFLCMKATHLDNWLTFLPFLPEGDHLIELPFYQPISFSLVQPFATGKRLLYPSEGTVDHHLQVPQVTLQLTVNDQMLNVPIGTPRHLVAVPAGADPVIVVADGDPAEGAEQRCDLHVEDVGQVALKLSPHQEYLKERLGWVFGRHWLDQHQAQMHPEPPTLFIGLNLLDYFWLRPSENIKNTTKAKKGWKKILSDQTDLFICWTRLNVFINCSQLFNITVQMCGLYLAAVLHPLGAMHHDVDFWVGSSTSDVARHNLNFVHNTCRVVTQLLIITTTISDFLCVYMCIYSYI